MACLALPIQTALLWFPHQHQLDNLKTDTQTHPVGQNTTNIKGHYSSFSPTKNLLTITFIWQKSVNIRAEIETSARPLPIKCPVAQKYISDLFGMPCRMSMEEQMTFWKTCNACMKWKFSKQNKEILWLKNASLPQRRVSPHKSVWNVKVCLQMSTRVKITKKRIKN